MSVSPWFIKNGPRETIPCICWFCTLKQIFQTTNHYRYDKQDHSYGSQWKHKLWKQPRWIKTYFSTLSPRDSYDVLVQTGSKIYEGNNAFGWSNIWIVSLLHQLQMICAKYRLFATWKHDIENICHAGTLQICEWGIRDL